MHAPEFEPRAVPLSSTTGRNQNVEDNAKKYQNVEDIQCRSTFYRYFGGLGRIFCKTSMSCTTTLPKDSLKRSELVLVQQAGKCVGVAGKISQIKSVVELGIKFRFSEFPTVAKFGVLPTISGKLPQVSFDKKAIAWPFFVRLADPTFNQTGDIDMLLGAEIYHSILEKGKIDLGVGCPSLQNTKLGWIFGRLLSLHPKGGIPSQKTTGTTLVTLEEVNESVSRFWDSTTYQKEAPYQEIVIHYPHQLLLHAGVENTLNYIKLKFWPVNAHSEVRKCIHACVECY